MGRRPRSGATRGLAESGSVSAPADEQSRFSSSASPRAELGGTPAALRRLQEGACQWGLPLAFARAETTTQQVEVPFAASAEVGYEDELFATVLGR
jgi:hypothetical protein